MRALWVLVALGVAWWYFFADRIRCPEYASHYRCKHVIEDATYDVYYWTRVEDDDPANERMIGTARGLVDCRGTAIAYAAQIGERWNDRAYICALRKDDGGYAEKHRLVGVNP